MGARARPRASAARARASAAEQERHLRWRHLGLGDDLLVGFRVSMRVEVRGYH